MVEREGEREIGMEMKVKRESVCTTEKECVCTTEEECVCTTEKECVCTTEKECVRWRERGQFFYYNSRKISTPKLQAALLIFLFSFFCFFCPYRLLWREYVTILSPI